MAAFGLPLGRCWPLLNLSGHLLAALGPLRASFGGSWAARWEHLGALYVLLVPFGALLGDPKFTQSVFFKQTREVFKMCSKTNENQRSVLSLTDLGPLLGLSWVALRRFWAVRGRPLAVLSRTLRGLGMVWSDLRTLLAALGVLLNVLGRLLAALGCLQGCPRTCT